MFKKNNLPIEDVLKSVAKKNKLEYIPPNKRRKKQDAVTILKVKENENTLSIIKTESTDLTPAEDTIYMPFTYSFKKIDTKEVKCVGTDISTRKGTSVTVLANNPLPSRRNWNRPKKVYGAKYRKKK